MIGSLRGVVLDRDPSGEVLLEVGGVGYRVVVTPRTLGALQPGEAAFLYTHHVQREDAQLLYGFASKEERWCFESLLAAHRVGPALALAILGTHGPAELRRIVREADVAALCLVPGVGKQTAARLLIELKGRLDVPELDVVAVAGGGNGTGGSAVAQVREALAGLGYGPEEIREVLRELDPAADASALLRESLRMLGARRA
jgi:Holliday junction DNA helicase RuvA